MTSQADPRTGGITYAQWLQRQVAAGGTIICGPPIIDAPTFWEDIFPPARWARPNHDVEAELQRQLDKVVHQRAEAGPELEASL